MTRNVHRIGALTLAGALAACARPSRQQAAPATGPATVVFENRSLHQAAVYAVPRSGAAVRIGTVPAGRTDTLAVDGAALPVGGMTIVADLFAISVSPSTAQLTLVPGDWIAVTLPPTGNTLTVLPVIP